jgi:hypothetical protein
VSSEEPRTASSLDPRGSGEALMARQVGRRSCGAKAAVRRDELGGASKTRQSCRELRGCAGRVSVAHMRVQKKA